MLSAKSDFINVFVRARPLRGDEGQPGWEVDNNTITEAENPDCTFNFDRIFAPGSTTQNIYETCVKNNIVSHVANGYNGTVFAYGQTSSGKTYTMMGNASTQSKTNTHPGITELALRDLFDLLEKVEKPKGYKIRVLLEMLEIYNENLRDLLLKDPAQAPTLRILEDDHGIYVRGAQRRVVVSADDALDAMQHEAAARITAATQMNAESSRSHCLIRITVEKTQTVEPESKASTAAASAAASDASFGGGSDADENSSPGPKVMERKVISSLNLVDLAGSERVSKTGATGVRLTEGGNINKSLSTLTTVIQKLSEPRKPGHSWHIPFRDSKLTHLLKTAIGGNSFTAVFCCMTLSDAQIGESRSTLQFAQRAKKIRNEVTMNEVADPRTRVRTLELEVKRLKKILVANDLYLWSKMLRIKHLEGGGAAGGGGGGVGAQFGSPTGTGKTNEEFVQGLIEENSALRSELQDALTAIAAMGGGGDNKENVQAERKKKLAAGGGGEDGGGGMDSEEVEELRNKIFLLESDIDEATEIKSSLNARVADLEDMLDELEEESNVRDKEKEEQITQFREQIRSYEIEKQTTQSELESLRNSMQQMREAREQEEELLLEKMSGDAKGEELTKLQLAHSALQFEHNTLFDMYSKAEIERTAKESQLKEMLQDAETHVVAVKNDMAGLQTHMWKFVNLATTICGGEVTSHGGGGDDSTTSASGGSSTSAPKVQQIEHALKVLSDMATRRGVNLNNSQHGVASAGATPSSGAGAGGGGEGGGGGGGMQKESSEEFSLGRNFRRTLHGNQAQNEQDPEVLQRKIRELENTILQKDNHRDVIIDTKLKRMQELVLRLHTAKMNMQLEVDRVVAENKRLHELVARDGKLSAIIRSDGLEPNSADMIKTQSQFAPTPNLPYNHN